MVIITLDDAAFKRMITWMHTLSDTLPPGPKEEMDHTISELSEGMCQTASVFDGLAFEEFLTELDAHPEPWRMRSLLDKARVRGGDQTPF